MSYDPKLYVVPVPGGFKVPVFHEDVAVALPGSPVLSAEQVLEKVRDVDVSVVCQLTHDWDVTWMHGRDLTLEELGRIAV